MNRLSPGCLRRLRRLHRLNRRRLHRYPQRAVSADIVVVDQPRMPTPGLTPSADPAAPSTTLSIAVSPSAQPSETGALVVLATEQVAGRLPDSTATGLPAVPPVVNVIPPTPQNSQPECQPIVSRDEPKPVPAEAKQGAEPLPRGVREVAATRILGEMWGADNSLMPPGPPATRTRGRSRANSVQPPAQSPVVGLRSAKSAEHAKSRGKSKSPRACQPDIVRAPSTPAVNSGRLFLKDIYLTRVVYITTLYTIYIMYFGSPRCEK